MVKQALMRFIYLFLLIYNTNLGLLYFYAKYFIDFNEINVYKIIYLFVKRWNYSFINAVFIYLFILFN